MKQVFNPYLPAGEYIPDGEPHVFGNRVYVYGSHDRFNAAIFCVNDYVCYSAPVDDLSAWRYEGVIYKKKQDPLNKLGIRLLFAPDVVQGKEISESESWDRGNRFHKDGWTYQLRKGNQVHGGRNLWQKCPCVWCGYPTFCVTSPLSGRKP